MYTETFQLLPPRLHCIINARAVWPSTVSNSLKPQRRFNINGLTPASGYQLQVEAHNIAGSATEEYTFFTLTKDGGTRYAPGILTRILLLDLFGGSSI